MRKDKEKMLTMNQIDAIKEMQRAGKCPTEISEKLSIDRKTVTKYMALEDYNPELKPARYYPSKLDAWKGIIDGWLEEDKRMRFKQRHTARRIHERLLQEYPATYDCSYPLVQALLQATQGAICSKATWFFRAYLVSGRSPG